MRAWTIDRGTKGTEFLLSFVLFNIVPTIVEILMVCAILWALFDWRFAAITNYREPPEPGSSARTRPLRRTSGRPASSSTRC